MTTVPISDPALTRLAARAMLARLDAMAARIDGVRAADDVEQSLTDAGVADEDTNAVVVRPDTADELGLAPGRIVHAQVKSVALLG